MRSKRSFTLFRRAFTVLRVSANKTTRVDAYQSRRRAIRAHVQTYLKSRSFVCPAMKILRNFSVVPGVDLRDCGRTDRLKSGKLASGMSITGLLTSRKNEGWRKGKEGGERERDRSHDWLLTKQAPISAHLVFLGLASLTRIVVLRHTNATTVVRYNRSISNSWESLIDEGNTRCWPFYD